ncbi:uncharacterized protein LOC124438657 isoform X2 [Xenia sp. Carnegie-2017]|uniref:uncharacterized protein LOC124438657 isoform X2 n=1 Tax=Xenia sp. Carnegie-2017 TaxID=2897299 RepID=UPI001F033292|nr:uncharacterized protein LOC124438657 isoform X2 [Xenia sp. Carnegie-2017]
MDVITFGKSYPEKNVSDSIAYSGCFGNYNATSCVRDSVVSVFALGTALSCAVKLYHLYKNHHSLPNQYVIFSCGLIQCILCVINWIYLWEYSVIYVIEFLKILQCVIVCRFYCSLAAQIYRKDTIARYIPIVAIVFVLAVLGLCISGWITMRRDRFDCLAIQWILLASAEFVNAQFFLGAGYFVSKKLNDVRTLDDMRNSKKRELWGNITVFQISAIASVLHEAIFKALGDDGCHGILPTSASGFTAVYIAFKIIRWLLPIWVMAALFAIEDNTFYQESLTSLINVGAHSISGFRSRFRPTTSDPEQFVQSTESTNTSVVQPKQLMLPPFLRTGKYGSLGRPVDFFDNSGKYEDVVVK